MIATNWEECDGLDLSKSLYPLPPCDKGAIPCGISSLAALEWINLSENLLTGPVPVTLSGLTRLVELNLSANRLSGPLPSALCGLASLVSLQLSHNDLEGYIPTEVCLHRDLPIVSLLRMSSSRSPRWIVDQRWAPVWCTGGADPRYYSLIPLSIFCPAADHWIPPTFR